MANDEDRLVVETDFPVRYAETDAMGVVHHATYLVYLRKVVASSCGILAAIMRS